MTVKKIDTTPADEPQDPTKSPAMGRPTKYKREYCYDIVNWFSQPTTKEVVEVMSGNNWSKESVRTEPIFFPTMQGYAAHLGVDGDTLVEWASAHSEFSAAVKRAKGIQEAALLTNSMIKQYDGRFATFFAMNNMGMKTKQEDEHRYPDGPMTVQVVKYDGEQK